MNRFVNLTQSPTQKHFVSCDQFISNIPWRIWLLQIYSILRKWRLISGMSVAIIDNVLQKS